MTRAVDTVVIGGGVIGCAVAYYASKRGQRVVLIDAAKRGRATSASAGGLWPMGESLGMGCGVIFFKAMLERGELDGGTAGPSPLPASFFDFTLRSNALFPPLVEELREATEIDVEFDRSSLLFLMYDDGDVAFAESLKTSHTGDLPPLDWLTPQALAEVEPAITRELEGAVRLHGEDQINPYRLSDALRAAARAQGAVVVSHTEVTGIRTELDRVVAVETADAVFPCKAVVNAAGAWAGHIGRMVGLDLPVEPVRGQIICSETLPPLLHSCLSTSSGYLVQKRHGEIIIGSTTEETGFDVRVTPAAMRDLSAAAVRALDGRPPVGVKVFVEGEEEIGSLHLTDFLGTYGELLAADAIVIADSGNWETHEPALTTSLRGLIDCEIELRTLDVGVHSGMWGGAIPDALTVLVRTLASLHDDAGQVAVPGLVRSDDAPVDLAADTARRQSGMAEGVEFIGSGRLTSRLWNGPAAAILAIDTTPVAEAINQLIPAARAKVSVRLAPGDEPARAMESLVSHLKANVPWNAQVTFTPGAEAQPFALDTTGPAYEAWRTGFRESFGREAIDIGVGGSIPFVPAFSQAYPDASILLTGAGDPASRAHGPNESLDLEDFKNSALTEAIALRELAG